MANEDTRGINRPTTGGGEDPGGLGQGQLFGQQVGAPATADQAPQSSPGLLGFETGLNRRIFGEAPREAFERFLSNEFRGIGGLEQFAAPGFQQRQGMAQQLFGLQPGSLSGFDPTLQQLAQGLQATAAGRGSGQSLADRAAAMQQSGLLAQQAGARGPQAAAAARQFGANQGNIAQQAVQGRMQAQQAAAQQLQQLASQARGQDIQAGLRARELGFQGQISNAELLQQALLAQQQARTDRFGAIAEAAGTGAGAQPIETAGVGAVGGALGAFF